MPTDIMVDGKTLTVYFPEEVSSLLDEKHNSNKVSVPSHNYDEKCVCFCCASHKNWKQSKGLKKWKKK